MAGRLVSVGRCFSQVSLSSEHNSDGSKFWLLRSTYIGCTYSVPVAHKENGGSWGTSGCWSSPRAGVAVHPRKEARDRHLVGNRSEGAAEREILRMLQ